MFSVSWFTVWVLSVTDQLFWITLCLGTTILLATTFGISDINLTRRHGLDLDKEDLRPSLKKWRVFSLVLIGVSLITPRKDEIVKGYIMLEGSKVVRAENAKQDAERIANKLDKLIDTLRR